jgi:hypothetical protein
MTGPGFDGSGDLLRQISRRIDPLAERDVVIGHKDHLQEIRCLRISVYNIVLIDLDLERLNAAIGESGVNAAVQFRAAYEILLS